MIYTIQEIKDKLPSAINIDEFLRVNNIKINKNGAISAKNYNSLVEYCTKQSMPEITKEKIHYILNGHHIQVKSKPFFESVDKRVSLFQDDAINFLKALPDGSVDVIITDPAYSGMNQKLKLGSGKIIGVYKNAGEDGAKWFEEFHDTEENYKAFLQECFRVLKDNRHIYLMFDSYSLLTLAPVVREVFEVKNLLCWDKANIGLGHYFRRRHEFIMFASKGKRPLNSKNIPDVWKIKRIVRAEYPTQKPTEVFELMLKGSASKDYVVCDPFLGSGSSAIAAIKNGCKFVGCDIAEKSVSISANRVSHFIKNNIDPLQKLSLVSDDESMLKILSNGKPK